MSTDSKFFHYGPILYRTNILSTFYENEKYIHIFCLSRIINYTINVNNHFRISASDGSHQVICKSLERRYPYTDETYS